LSQHDVSAVLNLKSRGDSLHTIAGQSEFKTTYTSNTLDISEKISGQLECNPTYIIILEW